MHPRCPITFTVSIVFTAILAVLIGHGLIHGHLQPTMITGVLTVGCGISWAVWAISCRLDAHTDVLRRAEAETVAEAEAVLRTLRY